MVPSVMLYLAVTGESIRCKESRPLISHNIRKKEKKKDISKKEKMKAECRVIRSTMYLSSFVSPHHKQDGDFG